MPQYVEVPRQRLAADVLHALLEEYASRDGTDYGEREKSLQEKVAALEMQLQRSELRLLYEMESEQWDLVPAEQAAQLLDN
ncbi:MAG: YheU family protein [Halioglobus sp.]